MNRDRNHVEADLVRLRSMMQGEVGLNPINVLQSEDYQEMKILQVAASLLSQWGRPTSVITGLSRALLRKGVKVSIFAPVKQGAHEIARPERAEVRLFRQDPLSRIWRARFSGIVRAFCLRSL